MTKRSRVRALGIFIAVLITGQLVAQTAAKYKSRPEQLPREVAAQPIPFNHKLHAAAAIKCTDCHTGTTTNAKAGLPQLEQCMLCHSTIATDREGVRKLAALAVDERIEWQRVYRVPEFIFFSHRSHSAAKLTCAQCHGPVETRDVLAQELSTNMVSCMNCHADRQVSNECFLCHDLGQ